MLADGREVEPEIRRLSDLKRVLMSPDALKEDSTAYLIYRDLPPLTHSVLRFDLTVVLPWEVGGELAKTKGHYHLPVGGRHLPEVYFVHSGEATFLVQRRGPSPFEVEDFLIVRARQGSLVEIPPEYGHVTVNSGRGVLVMSNVIHRGVRPDYETYELTRGAAYYLTREGIVRNGSYKVVPEPRHGEPVELREPIMDLLMDREFLKRLL